MSSGKTHLVFKALSDRVCVIRKCVKTNLRLPKPVAVADVEDSSDGGGVDSPGAALLQAKVVQDLVELRVFPHVGQLHVHPGPEPCAQVAGTGENVAEMRVPLELPAFSLDVLLNLKTQKNFRESCRQNFLHSWNCSEVGA